MIPLAVLKGDLIFLMIFVLVIPILLWALTIASSIIYPMRAKQSLKYYWQFEAGFVLFQFFLISLIFAALFTRELLTETSLQIAAWPIWGAIYTVSSISKYWNFVGFPLAIAGIAMLMVARWQWRSGPGWKRSLWPTKGLLAFFAIFLLIGEICFQWQFRSAVLQTNPDCVVPGTFINSLRIAPADFQWYLHAQTRKDQKSFGWSYQTQDLYLVPERAANNAGAQLGYPNWTGYPDCPWRPRSRR